MQKCLGDLEFNFKMSKMNTILMGILSSIRINGCKNVIHIEEFCGFKTFESKDPLHNYCSK